MPTVWRVLDCSVRGARHVRNGTVNQDAVGRRATATRTVVAVADGHGSAKSFRSDRGARMAVESALDVLSAHDGEEVSREVWRATVGRAIVERWQERVDADLAAEPPAPGEGAEREATEGRAGGPSKTVNPRLAYGATLLALVVDRDGWFAAQLGDGDILRVAPGGRVERVFARDPRLMGDETTSLCMLEAWRQMRVTWSAWSAAPTAMLLASTDGYSNAFKEDAGFLKVGGDLWETVETEGWEVVERELPGWLSEASREGSGDDVTVALVGRETDEGPELELGSVVDVELSASREEMESVWRAMRERDGDA